MDEGWLPLARLHEIRLERVLQQDGHGARHVEALGSDRSPVEARRDRDRPETAPKVTAVPGHCQKSHDLGGRRDVESTFTGKLRILPEPDSDPAQDAVLDVDAAAPRDRGWVDAELVAM